MEGQAGYGGRRRPDQSVDSHIGSAAKVSGKARACGGLCSQSEVEDTVEAWMEFPGSRRACFYASNGYATDAPVILEIQGEKGRITIQDQEVTLWTEQDGFRHIPCETVRGIGKSYWGAGHRACIRDYYKALGEGISLPIDLRGVETTFDTMMRIYECAEVQGAG